MSNICDVLTDNGQKCINSVEFVKIKKFIHDGKEYSENINFNCKNYCKQHSDLIINSLRKKFDVVYINDKLYNIENISIFINDISINLLTDEQIKQLMNDKITIKILVLIGDSTELSTMFKNNKINKGSYFNKIEWGTNKERWITTNDWIFNNIYLIYEYEIQYSGNVIKNPTNICETQINPNKSKFLGKGGYGVTKKTGNIVIKYSDYIRVKNNIFFMIYGNIREILFLTNFIHHNISFMKCIEYINTNKFIMNDKISIPTSESTKEIIDKTTNKLIKPTNFEDKIFKLHLKYDGNVMSDIDIQYYNEPSEHLKYTNLQNKSNLTYVIYQLLNIFDELEKFDIIHGDIKPENILVDDLYKTTIIDWGAVSFNSYGKSIGNGTYSFIDPESMLPDVKKIGPKNDIFSLGLSILFLYSRVYLNFNKYIEPTYETGGDIDLSPIDDIFIKNIVSDMVNMNYDDRLSANQLLQKYFNDSNLFYHFKLIKIPEIKYDATYFYNNVTILDRANNIITDKYKTRNYCIDMIFYSCYRINYWKCTILSVYIYDLLCNIYLQNEINIDNLEYFSYISITLAYICIYNIFDFKISFEQLLYKYCMQESFKAKFNIHLFYILLLQYLQNVNYKIYKITFETQLHKHTFDLQSPEFKIIYDTLKNICKDLNLLHNEENVIKNVFNIKIQKHEQLQKYLLN